MKYIIIILINSFLFTNLLMAEKFCESQANCLIVTSDKTNNASDTLSCKLTSLNTLTMKANHVLTKEGKLKHYWDDNKTVCDVLGWINDGINSLDKMDGIVTSLNKPTTINLNLKHVFGQLTANSYKGLQLDIDIDKQGENAIDYIDDFSVETCNFDDDFCDAVSDGNDLVSVRPFQTVHEMFHFIQEQTATLKYKWVNEGTARMFEDVVYDDGNSYLNEAYKPFYRKPYIPNILENLVSDKSAYKTFGIWKLIQEKCTLDMHKMLTKPLINFNTIAQSCSQLPNILEDKLANLFLYYNWAILYKEDFSLIDTNEPKANLFPKRLEKINNKDFKGTLDMKYIVNGTIPAYGAKSFLITHETLKGDTDMNLTFKSDGDLKLVAVRVKEDGNSDVNDNFVMDGSNQTYKLTELDKAGGLFVTLVNSTGVEIKILDLKFKKKNKAVAEYLFEHNTKDTVAGKYDLRHWETGAVPKEFTYNDNDNGKMGASGIFFNTSNNDTWLEVQGDSNWGITSGNASFSFWVKMAYPSYQSASSIFGNGAYPHSGLYGFEFKHSNAGFIYEYQDPYLRTGGHAREYFKNTNILPNEWNHVVVVFESTKIYPRVYLNGIELVDIDLWVDAHYDHPPHKNGMQQHISTQHGNIGMTDIYDHRFIGELDTFRVYDYPLSQTEIDALFEEGNK